MSIVTDQTRKDYLAQRGVSQGAHITLTPGVFGWVARFECAKRCIGVLKPHFGWDNEMPIFIIETEDAFRALLKLYEAYSVALVDAVTDEKGTRFVLIWKIPARAETLPDGEQAPDPNQISLNLEDY